MNKEEVPEFLNYIKKNHLTIALFCTNTGYYIINKKSIDYYFFDITYGCVEIGYCGRRITGLATENMNWERFTSEMVSDRYTYLELENVEFEEIK